MKGEEMDTEKMLEEIVKGLIKDEDVERIIRDEVRERFSYSVEKAIHEVAMEFVREKGETWIRQLVDATISGKVRLDDGWGNVKEEGTFEDYVRKSMRSQCISSWNIEKELRKAVDERLKKYCQDVSREHVDDNLASEVLKRLAKDYGEETR